ncbi:MAG: exo-alpha-sialidase [Firmicutes bacterium]|nr:exo-alpha-sialidase [Bacillota bacterium]
MDPKGAIEKVLELEPSEGNPRNSEGAIIELGDGRLLLAYTHFYGGASDDAPAYIAGRYSNDRGRSWDKEDIIILENEGSQNVMSVSFLRLDSGRLGLFYAIKNSWGDLRLFLRESGDEGASWGEKICCTPQEGYFVVNNDRVVKLANGRIIVPVAYHRCPDKTRETWSHRGISMCFFSDDGGKTWRRSETELSAPEESNSGLQEPGIIELKDGSLMMWSRTDLGSQYVSYSCDGGLTWSRPGPSSLVSPLSPASIKRIPSTGDLLCIYNDHSGRFSYITGKRTPLVAAISSNEGRSWRNHKLIESDPDGCYCYTLIAFVDDTILLGYCAGDTRVGGLNRLRVVRVGLGWFYRED